MNIRVLWTTTIFLSLAACSSTPEISELEKVARARTVPEQAQFDFWLGNWELTWGDSGKGTNWVSSELNEMVIHEYFDGQPSIKLVGESFSTFNTRAGLWQQTWVDNQGGYLDFKGRFEDDKMILSRDAVDDNGDTFKQRMVWRDITKNSFEWDWQRSQDSGETWQTMWQISYQRSD